MADTQGDELRTDFAKGTLRIGAVVVLVFGVELALELYRTGWPALKELSWAGVSNNVKLVDALSPVARAYNNVLAMLLATIGLAIPLTANMHTPKLIDLFLRDRVNQVVLVLSAVGAAHVLWVMYIVGPGFAPVWAFRLAVYGSLLGWVVLIPYFFYVVRFLDPSTVIHRLHAQSKRTMNRYAADKHDAESAQSEIQEQLFQIGTIVIKALDRADRGVAREGVWTLKRLIDHYGAVKSRMDDAWFKVDQADFVGMSHHAIRMINAKHTWIETHVLYQLVLCYRHALAKAPDEVSTISNVNRRVAVEAAARQDRHVVSLCIRVFNTFLRDALNRKDTRAAYDIFYQYRQLAGELREDPRFVRRIGEFFVTYANVARQTGSAFVADLAAFDLAHVMEEAYEADSAAAPDLLALLLGLGNTREGVCQRATLRAKLLAAGFFAEHERRPELEQVLGNLRELPSEDVRAAVEHLVSIEKRAFWELTDRAVNMEWTSPARRTHLRQLVRTLRGSDAPPEESPRGDVPPPSDDEVPPEDEAPVKEDER
jgi:hypothetical protein